MVKNEIVFVCGGRTGGPLLPCLALAKELNIETSNLLVLGIKKGFEDKYCHQNNINIEYLPEAKLSILSFKIKKINFEIVMQVLHASFSLILLVISFLKSIFLILKYKPKLIISAGGFTAVPVIFCLGFLRLFKLTNCKIIIHQQDPLVGLTNKLTLRFANIISYCFAYTKDNFKSFKNAILVNNFLDTDKFNAENNLIWENENFLKIFSLKTSNSKQNLLVYAGGSGSKVINDYISTNISSLVQNFNIIHLLGGQQDSVDIVRWKKNNNLFNDYFCTESTYSDIHKLLLHADKCVARAGVGTISELQFLDLPTVLIPLAGSHQELNASLASNNFISLEEKNITNLNKMLIELNERNYKFNYKISLDNYYNINSYYINQARKLLQN